MNSFNSAMQAEARPLLERFRCIEDNIGFVMLGEVLRARSHQLVEQLQADTPNLQAVKRLALNMKLSTDNLTHDAGLVSRVDGTHQLYAQPSNEPASLESIIELCSSASRHRLNEINVSFSAPKSVSSELFVTGNPWELAYAIFFACIRGGQALAHFGQFTGKARTIYLQVISEADFADVILYSPMPLEPTFDLSSGDTTPPYSLTEAEWYCLQRLVSKNNTHIQTQLSSQPELGKYALVFRLPTFHPGHEEPLDFLRVSEPPQTDGQT